MLAPHKRITLACRPGTASQPTGSCTRCSLWPMSGACSHSRHGARASLGAPAPNTMKGFLMKGGHCGMSAMTQPLPPSLAFTCRAPTARGSAPHHSTPAELLSTAQPPPRTRAQGAERSALRGGRRRGSAARALVQREAGLAGGAGGRAGGHLQGDVGAVLRAPARRLAGADAGLARHEALRGHAQERVARALDLGVQVDDCARARARLQRLPLTLYPIP